MTQQEFFLQAAIQIAAQLHPNNRAFDDEEECNINTYAAGVATDLLEEVQIQWNERCRNKSMYGALFNTDPRDPQEQANDDDYALYVSFGGNKVVMHSIIADNDAQAIEKALDIFERAFVKQGAKHYALKRGGRTIKEG